MSSPVISPQWYPEFEVDTTICKCSKSIDISGLAVRNQLVVNNKYSILVHHFVTERENKGLIK
ncbi:hypothetical protein V1478_005570 [Vespula squamosa]|uniref:Uncharacterized protein n=1 Tax=Vespula squamosa TaxID=30214 RepID=A0ABD2BAN9_VESSQ